MRVLLCVFAFLLGVAFGEMSEILSDFKAPKNELLDKISPFENAPKAYEKDAPQIDVGGEIRLRYEKQIGSKSLKRPEKGIEGSLHIGIKP